MSTVYKDFTPLSASADVCSGSESRKTVSYVSLRVGSSESQLVLNSYLCIASSCTVAAQDFIDEATDFF